MKKLFVNCLLLAFSWIVVELCSFAIFFVLHRTSFHSEVLLKKQQEAATMQIAEVLSGNLAVPHPYLGFVYNPDATVSHYGIPISSYGFIDAKSPFYRRSADRYIVAVFGASVAWQWQFDGRKVFESELERAGILQGRKLIVVPLALGGYRQPQHLQALSYLLSQGAEFDAVITLDGFNEVALRKPEEVKNPAYPQFWEMFFQEKPTREETFRKSLLEFARSSKRAWAKSMSESSLLRHSPFLNLLWELGDKANASLIYSQRAKLDALATQARNKSFSANGRKLRKMTREKYYQHMAKIWAESSLLMSQICQARGISYFHFLQPNEHDPGSKPLSEEEQKMRASAEEQVVKGVQAGYPQLRKEAAKLVEQGVPFFDMSQIFKDASQTLYVDACCHLGVEGNETMSRFIVDRMLQRTKHSAEKRKGMKES